MTSEHNGITEILSHHSGKDTESRLTALLAARSITVFSVVDHSGEAEKVGMKMPFTKVVIFGNPKSGTPLMLAAPSVAIDLPLKILIREDADGKAWISYNDPAWLQKRHGFSPELLQNIAAVSALAEKAAE